LSFFDEADEPRPASRPAARRRGPTGGGRRPPASDPSYGVRRGIALGGLVILVILIGIGVHSCQVDQRNSALKDYNSHVAAVIQSSQNTSRQFFQVLSGRGGAGQMRISINQARDSAASELNQAKGFSVPGGLGDAQRNLVLALQMRVDGIAGVGGEIEQAVGGPSTSQGAINAIATQMARLYASDVLYKDYTLPLIVGALKNASIPIGGLDGQQIVSSQFLPDIRWVQPSFVASQLNVSAPSTQSQAKPAPGTHGHHLISVTVGGVTLTPGGSATLPASPAPTFTLNFQNTGQNVEHNVVCQVSVSGTSVSAQTVVPQTNPGQNATCTVPLTSAPTAGTYSVTARIERVPGEVSVVRNSQTFSITFR